jgi:nickel-type superoxide dismutase maturation protease
MSTPFLAVSRQTYHRGRVARIALLAAGAAVAWAVLRWRPFRVEVAGSSMVPALQPGDWAVGVRGGPIRTGDVVVVRHPGRADREMVKRVTGVPGEGVHPGRTLGADEWFVVGDNAEASTDSRALGPVPRAAIVGRVRLVYWPPDRWGRPHRAPK